ncbi:30S ribosome-binding factor RbfA [Psychrosphaera ytuae]|uniref:Ribosome-binding factor A n=2 Tax=Psychrosphaera ytuae TaxID=2820710 RepID=A0A975DFQ2_9GAMM|nr:30S ribosome-binding factor RbfA [Psychrosphaera ytuae]QTH64810.1 30S ribosome-binding factor RbfA [Psychrosphaera ytuae]
MQRDFSRTDRVAQQVQQEIAMILQRDFKDPRVGWTTVSAVEVSKDLAYVTVFVTFFGKEGEEIQQAIDILNKAGGFFRSEIGKRMRLRIVPEVKFEYDNSLVTGIEMSKKVDDAINKDKTRRAESGDNPAEDLDD